MRDDFTYCDNYKKINRRLKELYENGLVDDETPIITVLETITQEFYELEGEDK